MTDSTEGQMLLLLNLDDCSLAVAYTSVKGVAPIGGRKSILGKTIYQLR